MNPKHKAIRSKLRSMTKPAARALLSENLPEREYAVIYLCDVEQKSELHAVWKLNYTVDTIKNIRRQGYEKLVAVFFPKYSGLGN